MVRIKYYCFVIAVVLLFACGESADLPSGSQALFNEAQLYSVLWHQTAAEYHALLHQGYNLARYKLDEDLKTSHEKPPAIVLDIDETILGNTAYNARSIIKKQKYPEEFHAWIASAQGQALPGALEFLRYADEKGYQLFYISNRDEKTRTGTLKNLQKLGFPQAENSKLLLRQDTSSKELRRRMIAAEYDVVLLLGDNLLDFADIFEEKTIAGRYRAVEQYKTEFGDKFIIFPNSMHGEWLKVLLAYQRNLDPDSLRTLLLKNLRTD